MKLRNKRTGKIVELEKIVFKNAQTEDLLKWNTYEPNVNSLAELNKDWEDYKPAEPLIKDDKIRKAVRVWAEVNKLEPDFEVRYSENTFSLISWQACIEFNTQIDGLEHEKKYTITELCGGEQE